MDFGKTTVAVFSHPNHEMAIYGILKRIRPFFIFLTDGGGEERVNETKQGLTLLGLLDRAIFLNIKEDHVYHALLERDIDFFKHQVDQIANIFRELEPAQVLSDSIEFYNPVHDMTLALVDTAREAVAPMSFPIFEVPLVYQTPDGYQVQRPPKEHRKWEIRIALSEEELDLKMKAWKEIYTILGRQIGYLVPDPRDIARIETVVPAIGTTRRPQEDQVLRYEWRGRELKEKGEISEVITLERDVLPVILELGGMS